MGECSDDDDETFIIYGTPLQQEEESRAGQRRKELKDPALTRQLPLHQQEVTDAEGRRRFHGAFTGGYSAGYYNTVGSLEGWNPSTFKSSRDERLKQKGQRVEDFMDDDELAEAGISKVQPTAEYDTFGSTAAELARRQAQAEATTRAGGQLSFLPDDIIAPVADSMGIRLLQAMGWRQGKGVGPSRAAPNSGSSSRWGKEAGIGAENVPIYALPPKTDTHGLGFDPFKGAEDFRQAKRQKTGETRTEEPSGKKKRGIAFGSGALEDTDTFGYMDDYTSNDRHNLAAFSYEVASDDEDTGGLPGRGPRLDPQFMLAGKAAPLSLQSSEQARQKDMIPGFVKAKEVVTPKVYPPPKIPPSYRPVHQPAPQLPSGAAPPEPPAKEVQPPEVADLKRTIDAMAPFVARNGAAFEAIAVRQNARDNRFSFLKGGPGAEYYRWRVQVAKQEVQATQAALRQQKARLTATDRGALLGETALPAGPPSSAPSHLAGRPDVSGIAATDKHRLQDTLASTFMQATDQNMGFSSRPQGLQSMKTAGGSDSMSKAEAAQPAAAAAASSAAAAFLSSVGSRFASGGVIQPEPEGIQTPAEASAALAQPGALKRPIRTSQEWRPEPLLCKRFNVPDPFKGRAAPAKSATQFRSNELALPDTAAAAASGYLPGPPPMEAPLQLPGPPSHAPAADQAAAMDSKAMADSFLEGLQNGGTQAATQGSPAAGLPPPPQLPLPPGLDSASAAPYQQKPIDLFKAIFEASDSDEDDGEEEEAEKKDTAMEDVVDAGDKGKPLGSVGSAAGAQNSVRAAEQGTNAAAAADAATVTRDLQDQSRSAAETSAGDIGRRIDDSSAKSEPTAHVPAVFAPQRAEQRPAGPETVPGKVSKEQALAIAKALKDHKKSKDKRKKKKHKKKHDRDKRGKSKDSKSKSKSKKTMRKDDAHSNDGDSDPSE